MYCLISGILKWSWSFKILLQVCGIEKFLLFDAPALTGAKTPADLPFLFFFFAISANNHLVKSQVTSLLQ